MFVRDVSMKQGERRLFYNTFILCIVMQILSVSQSLYAQLAEKLYTTDYQIDHLRKGQLLFEVDNMSFYKNNEYGSTVQKGYTLPGFWLQMKAVYYPLSNLKLEAGAYSIWFWGTTRYPALAFKNIPTFGGRDYSNNVHVLPYFRANLALSENVNIVLGNIYGGSNHGLIEPLYNPELNLSSDPEKGMQLLYKTKWLNFDVWIDWMSFIYNKDTIQEAFAVGSTAKFKLNPPDSRFHVYLPLQGLAYHKGGEINISNASVQTVMNGSFGAGLIWNTKSHIVNFINMEFDVAGHIFPKGRTYQPERGRGYYTKLAMQLKDFNISSSYWAGNDFISMFGNAFYSSISTREEYSRMLFSKPKMIYFGVDYTRTIGKGFVLGINAETYYYLSGKMYSTETGLNQLSAFGHNTIYSFGVYMRINPSFLIKQY